MICQKLENEMYGQKCREFIITSSLLKLVKVARMEMKLGTYAYSIISMTSTCFYDDYIL